MSFWPFGQSISSSNINKILEEYFSVLHSLEKSNPNVAKSVRQSLHGAQETMQKSGAEFVDSMDSEPRDELLESAEPIQQKRSGGSSPGSSVSSSSSSLSSSGTGLDDDKIQNSTAPLVSATTISSLNSSYIDRLLNESELLNELTRQNSNLLDFICFGFFYDERTNHKVPSLEYLIDQLMGCIDKISPLTTSLADVLEVESTPSPPPPALSSAGRSNDSIDDNDNDNDDEADNKEPNYLSRATIISEIFSLDIWLITESLVNNQSYLSKIWSILSHPNLKSERSPLVPIFLKINQNFLITRQDQYLNFVRLRTNLVDDMLQHISISMLMDFFLKIIATDKVESPTGLIELVNDQRLIPKCLGFLNNNVYSSDVQACVGDFLKALIAISANAPLDDMSIGPNALTRQLASQESIDQLVDIIINKRGSALSTTVSIVIELIRKNNSDYDQVNLLTTTIQSHPPSNHDPIYLGYLLKTFSQHLPTLFQIIIDAENDSNNPILENQLHEKFRPLGFERFKIVELVAELLHCSNMGLMNSKRAERIVKERDHVRKHMVSQLQDAIQDLTITPEESPNETSASSTSKRCSSRSGRDSSSGKCNTNSKDKKQNHRGKEKREHQEQQYTHDDNDENDDDDRSKVYDSDEGNDNKATKAVSSTKPTKTTTTAVTNDDSITTNKCDTGVTGNISDENSNNNTITTNSTTTTSNNDNNNNNNNNNNNDNDTNDNDDNNNISDNAINNEFDEEEDEVDESFEIPYVNVNQSNKLRKKPTIGDFFKIQLYDIQFLPKIIELFLTHPWNNFWHNVIFDIIQQIFNGRMDFSYNSFLVYSLFNLRGSLQFMPPKSRKLNLRGFTLTKDFILQGYQDSYHFYERYHTNLGYMGHLVLIAEEVVKFSKLYKVELISPDIHEALQDEEWRFYSEDVLNDTRMMYSKILGGGNYVDDGNGNIIPQLPDPSLPSAEYKNSATGNELINVESLEEQLGLSTESDLHNKLRELLIASSQKEVDTRNEKNGVLLLGPPPQHFDDVNTHDNKPNPT